MDEAKTATLLIIAPEEARRASTTFAIDTKHPSPPGLETDINGEVSLAPGQVGFFRPYPALIIIVLIIQGERERERGEEVPFGLLIWASCLDYYKQYHKLLRTSGTGPLHCLLLLCKYRYISFILF